jgi:hypothetical protein
VLEYRNGVVATSPTENPLAIESSSRRSNARELNPCRRGNVAGFAKGQVLVRLPMNNDQQWPEYTGAETRLPRRLSSSQQRNRLTTDARFFVSIRSVWASTGGYRSQLVLLRALQRRSMRSDPLRRGRSPWANEVAKATARSRAPSAAAG